MKIQSFLKLPVTSNSFKDLSGRTLVSLGQTTFGWVDRRCRQASSLKQDLFGGKSIILIGDPAQLQPVCDKHLYHSLLSNAVGEQGHFAYLMFNRVVILTENQRVKGSDSAQTSFKQLLLCLWNGKTTKADWNCLLGRQAIHVEDISTFSNATRLFYSNDDVATFNYNQLVNILGPIA